MSYWYNPSRSAVIWDAQNNQHIQPGARSTRPPSAQLVRTGKLIQVDDTSEPVIVETNEPIMITSGVIQTEGKTAKNKRK